jgi:hypothetical protein
MADLTYHRRAMMNIYFLIICQLLSQVTLLVDVMYCGDRFAVGFGEITVTRTYPDNKDLTFRMKISHFAERYCDQEKPREIVIERDYIYDPAQDKDICLIVPHLGDAEYIYKLLLVFNFMIVIYLILNIYFTAFTDRVPRLFRFRTMHNFYPLTYIIGSILYFLVSEAFTMEEGFTFAPGFFIMIVIFLLANGSSIFNRTKLQQAQPEEAKALLA